MPLVPPSIKNWLESFKSGASGHQLLAVHNGYGLWLGLVHFNNNEPELLATGQSTAIDAVAAISEARLQLAQQYTERLPRQVTFLSTCVLPALLDLPIEADKPRKTSEMDSMISWELETQVADNNDLYLLGAILVGRGLMSQSQRHETAVELEVRRDSGNGLARYGEVAIEQGFISAEQLQESLLLQEKLVVTDAHLACGWQVQTLINEDSTQHQWLAAGIDARVRRQWFNAFIQNGLKLTNILPLLGSAAPWAAMQSENGNVIVIEAHQDSVAVYRLERSQFASFQQQPRQYNQSLAAQCYGIVVEQLRSNTEAVLLVDVVRQTNISGEDQPDHQPPIDSDNDINELTTRLQREVSWLVPAEVCHNQPLPDAVIATFYGAAVAGHKHVLFSAEDSPVHLAQITPREPEPPLWKNKNFYRYGVPAVLLVAVIAHGGYSLWQRSYQQSQLDTLDTEYGEQLALNKQLSSITGEYKKQEDELSNLKTRSGTAAADLARLNNQVIHRTRLVPRLLKAISQSVIDNVMLDSIIEPPGDSRNRFNLMAWATDNSSASQFIERLQQLVGRLDYRVADPDIRSGIGRYGLNGYTIDLWLIPVVSTDSNSANNTGSKP